MSLRCYGFESGNKTYHNDDDDDESADEPVQYFRDLFQYIVQNIAKNAKILKRHLRINKRVVTNKTDLGFVCKTLTENAMVCIQHGFHISLENNLWHFRTIRMDPSGKTKLNFKCFIDAKTFQMRAKHPETRTVVDEWQLYDYLKPIAKQMKTKKFWDVIK